MASAAPAPSQPVSSQKIEHPEALAEQADLVETFWQRVSELGARDEQQRLAAIEQGLSSGWLLALRQHLHLKPADLEPLMALSEATIARRTRDHVPLDWVASERLDRLLEVISLAYGVFEHPASTEVWLKAPHPLLQRATPLFHSRTAIGAGQVRRLLQALEQGAPV
jgi:putative toxin-antitoxin system antitoxin component (TIGR02293 family)